MALTIPSALAHTQAVIAALQAAELTVGNGSGIGLTAPFCVVYTDLGSLDGPLGDQYADIDQTVMVHSVGVGSEQAQWVADKVRTTLLPGVQVDGRALLEIQSVTSVPVQRDDSIQPPLWFAVDEFHLSTTPA